MRVGSGFKPPLAFDSSSDVGDRNDAFFGQSVREYRDAPAMEEVEHAVVDSASSRSKFVDAVLQVVGRRATKVVPEPAQTHDRRHTICERRGIPPA